MENYKKEFIEFMVRSEVLRFGEFVTKSGRLSPFFINTGFYRTGSQLRDLGRYYAKALKEAYKDKPFDVLFGPAYKGIPLSVTTAIALSEDGIDVRYSSNRKEIKDHGDQGILLGSPLSDGDRVVMIEDVTTSGASIRETMPILKAQGDIQVLGLMVSINRMERGTEDIGALEQISRDYGIQTNAICNMQEVMDYLYNREIDGKVVLDDEKLAKIHAYYREYGVKKEV